MMDDLRAQFLPRFVKLARERVTTARALVEGTASPDDAAAATKTAAGSMHSLAGEAGLLGLTDLLEEGRRAERVLRAFRPGDEESTRACADVLARLDTLLDALRVGESQ
jgi:chemotaxis protein histidine kinase CheA